MNDFVFRGDNCAYPNYAWPGVHAIIYKLWLDDLYYFDNNDEIVENKNIYEIGIKFRKTGDNDWIKFTLLSSDNPISYNNIKNRVDTINTKETHDIKLEAQYFLSGTYKGYMCGCNQLSQEQDKYNLPDGRYLEIKETNENTKYIKKLEENSVIIDNNNNVTVNNTDILTISNGDVTSTHVESLNISGENISEIKDISIETSTLINPYYNGVVDRNGDIQNFSVPTYQWYDYIPGRTATWPEENIIYIVDMDDCQNKINPVYIIIDNLKDNTEYDLKAYYKESINGADIDFNEIGEYQEGDVSHYPLKTFPEYTELNIVPNVKYPFELDDVILVQKKTIVQEQYTQQLNWYIQVLTEQYKEENGSAPSNALIEEWENNYIEQQFSELEDSMKKFFWENLAKPAMKIINDMGVWKKGTNMYMPGGFVNNRAVFRVMQDVSFGFDFNYRLYAYRNAQSGGNVVVDNEASTWLDKTVRAIGKNYITAIDVRAWRNPPDSGSYTENGQTHYISYRSPLINDYWVDREAICKTMEFLTHSPKAMWAGDSGEFPFLNTETTTLGQLYRVVAGMFVNRHWWTNINTPAGTTDSNLMPEPNGGYNFYSRTDSQDANPDHPLYDPEEDWYVN